ncbi:hemin uptake protein HemP [Salinisphaera orenii]|uniref:hemin uptake protein HemP n=1 Tax=Salinisphaera orenii TaxID=856731 RepID=UPI000DBE504F
MGQNRRFQRTNDIEPSFTDTVSAADAHGAPRITSDALFGSARELVVVHRAQEYRLRCTKNGKLILTK